MQVIDASSIIYAWDNYPENLFPKLWDWIADEIAHGRLAIPGVAFEEVGHKIPECAEWLKAHEINRLPGSASILAEAMRIKGAVGIRDDDYHPKGVGENDLIIIATALEHGAELISDEQRQPNPPKEPRRRKIPAVCAMPGVNVQHITFIEYFKRAGTVF